MIRIFFFFFLSFVFHILQKHLLHTMGDTSLFKNEKTKGKTVRTIMLFGHTLDWKKLKMLSGFYVSN